MTAIPIKCINCKHSHWKRGRLKISGHCVKYASVGIMNDYEIDKMPCRGDLFKPKEEKAEEE